MNPVRPDDPRRVLRIVRHQPRPTPAGHIPQTLAPLVVARHVRLPEVLTRKVPDPEAHRDRRRRRPQGRFPPMALRADDLDDGIKPPRRRGLTRRSRHARPFATYPPRPAVVVRPTAPAAFPAPAGVAPAGKRPHARRRGMAIPGMAPVAPRRRHTGRTTADPPGAGNVK
jgi:hypothetical protein